MQVFPSIVWVMFETSLLFNSSEERQSHSIKPSWFSQLKQWWLPALVLSGIASVAIGVFLYRSPPRSTLEDASQVLLSLEPEPTSIYVYISGAVERPGVYPIEEGTRVADLISAAGGVSVTADKEYLNFELNLSQKLKDEQKVHIPFEGEVAKANEKKVEASNASSALTDDISVVDLISINTATEKELDTLPGVGPTTAKKIIEGRPYTDINQLLEKKIVGQALFSEIQSQLKL
ncbi:MAG: competence protein ComEA [Patescibacteria group bacterium]|nr:competence protein ComEA [Patescibacteria group bacterium]